MSFTEVASLDADVTVAIGGRNKKTGKPNPTKAEGYYLGSREVDSKKSKSGKAYIHFLQTPEGNLGIWGKTDLDRKITTVPTGTMVRVSFDKMVPTPNGDMYKFRVEQDSSNTIEVADFSDATTGGAGDDTDSSGTVDEDTTAEEEEVQEDAGAALAAATRRAKVEALLNKSNGKSK